MSFIRRRLTYANVALTVALLFLMTGGAYAARKYVITSTKQIKPSVLKSLQGKTVKTGAAGAQGPAGPAGPQGPAGANGKDGAAGKEGGMGEKGVPGTNGTNGTNGESVAVKSLTKGENGCVEGGSEFSTKTGKGTACTGLEGKEGAKGDKGEEGSPWTAGGVLPAEKSESGTWSMLGTAGAAEQPNSSSISYTIPLKAEPEAHYIGTNEELAGEKNEANAIKEGKCAGNVEKPEAASGNVCVFAEVEENADPFLIVKLIPSHFIDSTNLGIVVASDSAAAGEVQAFGTWVATGA